MSLVHVTCTFFVILWATLDLGGRSLVRGWLRPSLIQLPTERLLSIMVMVMPILCCSEEEASKCAHHSYTISGLVSALNFVKSLNIY